MKRAKLAKLAKDLEEIGYEILSVKALPWSSGKSPRKILSGMYRLEIGLIDDCGEDED